MTTWNPSDKTSGIVLSNGDLTASETSANTENVRSTDYHASGKWYFELTAVTSHGAWLGVRRSTVSISTKGLSTDSAGYRVSMTAGQTVRIAIDVSSLKIWVQNGTGGWIGGGNPELGSNPTDALDNAGDWHAWFGINDDTENCSIVANFGASAFAYTVPAGFTAWDGSNTLTVVSCSPDYGPIAGGTSVTITGTGFLSGATVTFDGVSATSVTVVSDTSITCTTPAGTVGFADIEVTNP